MVGAFCSWRNGRGSKIGTAPGHLAVSESEAIGASELEGGAIQRAGADAERRAHGIGSSVASSVMRQSVMTAPAGGTPDYGAMGRMLALCSA